VSNPRRKGKTRASKKTRKRHRRSASKSPPPTTLEILDGLFLRKMRLKIDGEEREVTAFEAIICHLLQKDAAGDGRASRVLLKYEELMRHGPQGPLQIAFADSDYTQSLAEPTPEASRG